MKNARVLITRDCNRDCDGCCNKYERIMRNAVAIGDLSCLAGYDIVSLTGGEPMLDPDRTLRIVHELRHTHSVKTVYVYTALWSPRFYAVARAADGIQYTVHLPLGPDDSYGLMMVQSDLESVAPQKSHRLRIDPLIESTLKIVPSVWSQILSEPWLSEDAVFARNGETGLPNGEALFILAKK